MSPRLPDGRFFGTTIRRWQGAEITLSEVEFPARAEVPRHSHARSIFNFVLSGGYTEYWGRRSMQCRRSALLFHPMGIVHSERFSSRGARCLTVEFDPARIARGERKSPALDDNAVFEVGEWSWVAARLRHELRCLDELSPLVVEGFLLVLLAGTGRVSQAREGPRPSPPVERARELLHARFTSRIRIREIAREVDLHPTYLARAFLRYYQTTPGEYARRLRIDLSCRMLIDGSRTLAQVAQAAGFADQSHFTRVFRRETGMTPGAFRKACGRADRRQSFQRVAPVQDAAVPQPGYLQRDGSRA